MGDCRGYELSESSMLRTESWGKEEAGERVGDGEDS
jgi:hypothetical protein